MLSGNAGCAGMRISGLLEAGGDCWRLEVLPGRDVDVLTDAIEEVPEELVREDCTEEISEVSDEDAEDIELILLLISIVMLLRNSDTELLRPDCAAGSPFLPHETSVRANINTRHTAIADSFFIILLLYF